MRVKMITLPNGERVARVDINARGIVATVDGTGADVAAAVADLRVRLTLLSSLAEEAACELPIKIG